MPQSISPARGSFSRPTRRALSAASSRAAVPVSLPAVTRSVAAAIRGSRRGGRRRRRSRRGSSRRGSPSVRGSWRPKLPGVGVELHDRLAKEAAAGRGVGARRGAPRRPPPRRARESGRGRSRVGRRPRRAGRKRRSGTRGAAAPRAPGRSASGPSTAASTARRAGSPPIRAETTTASPEGSKGIRDEGSEKRARPPPTDGFGIWPVGRPIQTISPSNGWRGSERSRNFVGEEKTRSNLGERAARRAPSRVENVSSRGLPP